jgi:predicted nucleotidyltransferase
MRSMPKMSPEEARTRAERAARFLAADPRVKLVFLFGSAADPDRKIPVRDVDLGIWTEPDLDKAELLKLRAAADDAAGGDIDLVSLNEAGVVLTYKAATTRQCLYADPPDSETEFICRSIMRYLDWKGFLEYQKHWEEGW